MKRIASFLSILILWVSVALAASPAFNPEFYGTDTDGDPLAGGSLYTYETGTTTPKTTWTDSTKGTPNSNPVTLDSGGRAAVWLDSSTGAYRFVLKDSGGSTVSTTDGIHSITDYTTMYNAVVAGIAADSVTEINTLSALTTYTGASTIVYVRGRSSDGDGYEGYFYWNSSDLSTEVAADTSHAVWVAPSGEDGSSGAWVRVEYTGAVETMWCGMTADGSTDDSASVAAADAISTVIIFPENTTIYMGTSVWWPSDDYTYIFNNTTLKFGVTSGRCIEMGMRTSFYGHLVVDADSKADTIALRFGQYSGGIVQPSYSNYIESIRPINFTTGGMQFYSDSNSGAYQNVVDRFLTKTSDTAAGFGIDFQTSSGALPKVNANYVGNAKIFGVDIGLNYNLAAGNTIAVLESEENDTWNIKVVKGRGLRIMGGNVEHVTATKNLSIADYPDVLECYFGCNIANIDQITYTYSANRSIFFAHQQYNYFYGRQFFERVDIGPLGVADDDQSVVDYLRVPGGMYAYRFSAGSPYFYFNAVTDGSGFWFLNNSRNLMYLKGTAPTSGKSAMLLLINDGGATSVKTVEVGADDSGGAGYQLLRVQN